MKEMLEELKTFSQLLDCFQKLRIVLPAAMRNRRIDRSLQKIGSKNFETDFLR
jgi:hypothetical protein